MIWSFCICQSLACICWRPSMLNEYVESCKAESVALQCWALLLKLTAGVDARLLYAWVQKVMWILWAKGPKLAQQNFEQHVNCHGSRKIFLPSWTQKIYMLQKSCLNKCVSTVMLVHSSNMLNMPFILVNSDYQWWELHMRDPYGIFLSWSPNACRCCS